MPEPMNDIPQEVAELKRRVDEISDRQKASLKRSWIDILSSLSPLISGVLIAAVGTTATIVYNNRQMHINHLNSLDKFRPYLDSQNPVERKFGYRAFTDLGEKDFVIELIAAKKDSAGLNELTILAERGESKTTEKATNAADMVMAKASSVEQREVPSPITTTLTGTKNEGWAYLGHWVATTKEWKTRYFDYGPDKEPSNLSGKQVKVRAETGALNVRAGMPTPEGQFERVIAVLKPGSETTVHEIKEWYSTGYMWARITYGT
jgi:hypothetical protein